jgi:hypothetical protein
MFGARPVQEKRLSDGVAHRFERAGMDLPAVLDPQ